MKQNQSSAEKDKTITSTKRGDIIFVGGLVFLLFLGTFIFLLQGLGYLPFPQHKYFVFLDFLPIPLWIIGRIIFIKYKGSNEQKKLQQISVLSLPGFLAYAIAFVFTIISFVLDMKKSVIGFIIFLTGIVLFYALWFYFWKSIHKYMQKEQIILSNKLLFTTSLLLLTITIVQALIKITTNNLFSFFWNCTIFSL